MILTSASSYAIRAITLIAAEQPRKKYCLLRDITSDGRLPHHFTGKILQDLVRSGLLKSVKGRGGGFALRKPPSEIRIIDIIRAVDPKERLDQCVEGFASCDDHKPCGLHDVWKAVNHQINTLVAQMTLAEVAASLQRKKSAASVRRAASRATTRDRAKRPVRRRRTV